MTCRLIKIENQHYVEMGNWEFPVLPSIEEIICISDPLGYDFCYKVLHRIVTNTNSTTLIVEFISMGNEYLDSFLDDYLAG